MKSRAERREKFWGICMCVASVKFCNLATTHACDLARERIYIGPTCDFAVQSHVTRIVQSRDIGHF